MVEESCRRSAAVAIIRMQGEAAAERPLEGEECDRLTGCGG